jgi:hypothetical protein
MALERLTQFRILKDIHVMKLRAEVAQRGDRLGRKAALREIGIAFHEQHHRRAGEFLADSSIHIHLHSPAMTYALNYGGRWPILQTDFWCSAQAEQ